jgi:hypothetical protein
MKNSTLITTEKYNRVIDILIELQRLHRKGPVKVLMPTVVLKFDKIYELKSNIGKHCLYQNDLMVTTYKEVFYIMLMKHTAP